MVLGAMCLAVLVFLTMIATLVAAYFLWHGAVWWANERDEERHRPRHQASPRRPSPAGGGHPPEWTAAYGRGAAPHRASYGAEARDFGVGVDVAHGQGFEGAARPQDTAMGLSGATGLRPRCNAPTPPPRFATEVEPSPPRAQSSRPVIISPVARSADAAGPAASLAEPPPVPPETLMRGYAAQLSMRFGCALPFHSDNVGTVADAYRLTGEDCIYCFLCLEEVGNSQGGADLSLKKWGTGAFSARIWVVVLARFVKNAQRERSALDQARVHRVCEEWRYQPEHFIRELKSCEIVFDRKYGRGLVGAFQQNDILHAEVARARRVLAEHGRGAAPKKSRLALAETAAQAQPEACPALTSREIRPRAALPAPEERLVPAGPKRRNSDANQGEAKRARR